MKKINYDSYPFKNKVVDKLNNDPKKKKWSGKVESVGETKTNTERKGNTNKRGTKSKSSVTQVGKRRSKITNYTGENKGGYNLMASDYSEKSKTKKRRKGVAKTKSKEKIDRDFSTYDKDGKLISSSKEKIKSKTNKRGKTKSFRKDKIYRDGKTKRYRSKG
tara:strand:+ start:1444 stop:1929 length:486 start_codon:yes stop_codon:yes gene_type:complete